MPFYEYQCQRCGHHVEAMQKISDPPLRKCPECGKQSLQRLMSAPVFRLKGGGWYETDFKSDSEGKRNLADRPEAGAAKDDKQEPAAKEGGSAEGAAKDATKDAAKDVTPAKDAANAKDASPVRNAPPAKEAGKPAAAAKAAEAKPAMRPSRRGTPSRGGRPAAKSSTKAPARRR